MTKHDNIQFSIPPELIEAYIKKNFLQYNLEEIRSEYTEKAKVEFDTKFDHSFEFMLTTEIGNYNMPKRSRIVGYVDILVCAHTTVTIDGKQNRNATAIFPIEIKTSNDFKDIGKILRQVKKYRRYLLEMGNYGGTVFPFIIIADSIPNLAKQVFDKEGISYLEYVSGTGVSLRQFLEVKNK